MSGMEKFGLRVADLATALGEEVTQERVGVAGDATGHFDPAQIGVLVRPKRADLPHRLQRPAKGEEDKPQPDLSGIKLGARLVRSATQGIGLAGL